MRFFFRYMFYNCSNHSPFTSSRIVQCSPLWVVPCLQSSSVRVHQTACVHQTVCVRSRVPQRTSLHDALGRVQWRTSVHVVHVHCRTCAAARVRSSICVHVVGRGRERSSQRGTCCFFSSHRLVFAFDGCSDYPCRIAGPFLLKCRNVDFPWRIGHGVRPQNVRPQQHVGCPCAYVQLRNARPQRVGCPCGATALDGVRHQNVRSRGRSVRPQGRRISHQTSCLQLASHRQTYRIRSGQTLVGPRTS